MKLVFVGRLESENEITAYGRFLTELKKRQVKFDITWVGDGSLKNECQKFGRVTGMVKDISSYLKTADVILANSYLCLLEAQAKGKLVLALYSHPLKQAYLNSYPGSQFMLLSHDPIDLADKLLKLLSEPKTLAKLTDQARRFAANQTWGKIADVYEDLWNGR